MRVRTPPPAVVNGVPIVTGMPLDRRRHGQRIGIGSGVGVRPCPGDDVASERGRILGDRARVIHRNGRQVADGVGDGGLHRGAIRVRRRDRHGVGSGLRGIGGKRPADDAGRGIDHHAGWKPRRREGQGLAIGIGQEAAHIDGCRRRPVGRRHIRDDVQRIGCRDRIVRRARVGRVNDHGRVVGSRTVMTSVAVAVPPLPSEMM